MKIIFTGGGTGGHFYPIIAVAEAIHDVSKERKLIEPDLYYIAPAPYDSRLLYENGIIFKKSPAGKMRRYFSVWNIIDIFKTGFGVMKSVLQMFFIYPDVVFSKGGYASFPAVFAAKLFRIPVIAHESDAKPGRANLWAAKFARKIAISYQQTAGYFKREDVDLTGNPVRKELYTLAREGAHEFLKLDSSIPTVLIIGGSQGAQSINDTVIDSLPMLVEKYQIIHQTGQKNIEEVKSTADVALGESSHKSRYKPFGYLNTLAMRMAGGAADLVISRAGSGSIFEIAVWGLPSILIPIPKDISHDQHDNAFAYARSGAAVVIEQKNFTPHLLIGEIERLMTDSVLRDKMKKEAKEFAKPDAARKIAEAIIDIALKHEE
jgi:UDP-N-acetylglucosamine--N-acetylmuramyl-(pentapeptide) pyrophosphoryl-undecaprenol N-acetylglucosamine transferase